MDKEYYSDYYHLERNHWWFTVREKIIEDRLTAVIDSAEELKILNVGAATGRSSEMLAKHGVVTSVEYDKECCEFVNQELKIDVINASITELPFGNDQFDIVCAFDVVEHVDDHETAVKEMYRVCKKGGLLYVTVPAYMTLWSSHDEINQHFRRYTKKTLRNLFTVLPGSRVYSTFFNTLLFPPILFFRLATRVIPSKWVRKEGVQSDFNLKGGNGLVNGVLKFVFSIERGLLGVFRFPFGVSILWLWRK